MDAGGGLRQWLLAVVGGNSGGWLWLMVAVGVSSSWQP